MTDDNDKPRATVREIDGQLVLDDPDGLAVVRVVEKHNCRNTLELHAERVAYFVERLAVQHMSPEAWCVVLANVDDFYGVQLADVVMPGFDWDAIRATGQVPYARGLVSRQALADGVAVFDEEAAQKLREMPGLVVLVIDHGVAEVFPYEAR